MSNVVYAFTFVTKEAKEDSAIDITKVIAEALLRKMDTIAREDGKKVSRVTSTKWITIGQRRRELLDKTAIPEHWRDDDWFVISYAITT